MAFAYYTKARGGDLISVDQRWTRSDTIDIAYIRRSRDNGRTWSAPVELPTGERTPDGMRRRHPHPGFVDRRGRLVEFWTEGVLPSDDPLEGMRQWNIYLRVSNDGGRTFSPTGQIIQKGSEFNSRHPLPGIWTGKNCVMLGDRTCMPIASPDGGIALPAQITPLAPDGKLYNPRGAYTYTEAVVLHGKWQGSNLVWEMSDVVKGDPSHSTRGDV